MKDHDQICRFTFDNMPVRGQLVSLDASWQQCLQNCDANTDDIAKLLLGQALAAVSLLASTLKFDGSITLQIRGQGAIHLLVAQVTSKRSVRGLVRQSHAVEDESAPLKDIFLSDKMVITIDRGKGRPYQGIVPLTGDSIQHALEAYFHHSEQLPTEIWLACDEQSASGLLLQKLPGEEEDQDGWARVTQLASTINEQELLKLTEQDILHRLFHEESVRLHESEPVHFSCSCSRERTAKMIQSLGAEEARSILQEQGKVSVNCEFCNANYAFDAIDIEQIFNPEANDFTSHKTLQ